MIHVFGDSHVGSLQDAWNRRAAEFRSNVHFYGRHAALFRTFSIVDQDDSIAIASNHVPNVRPLDFRIDVFDDLYVFSGTLYAGGTSSMPAWKTYCPWSCYDSNQDLVPISDAVVNSDIESRSKMRLILLETMIRRKIRVAVVEAPKPFRRAAKMYSLRPDVMAATDHIARTHMKKRLDALGVTVISVPEETYCDGFTTEDYQIANPEDPHHGNRKFGDVMLDRILQWAATAR